MINGIAFTGRETMLGQPKKMVNKAYEYVASSKIYSTIEDPIIAAAEKLKNELYQYRSASKVYGSVKNEIVTKKTPVVDFSNRTAASYALSHGTPKEAMSEAVARSIDYTV